MLRKLFKIISGFFVFLSILIFVWSSLWLYQARIKRTELDTPIITLNGNETEPIQLNYNSETPPYDNKFSFDYARPEGTEEDADIKVETVNHTYYFAKSDKNYMYNARVLKTNALITVVRPFSGEVKFYDMTDPIGIWGQKLISLAGIFFSIVSFIGFSIAYLDSKRIIRKAEGTEDVKDSKILRIINLCLFFVVSAGLFFVFNDLQEESLVSVKKPADKDFITAIKKHSEPELTQNQKDKFREIFQCIDSLNMRTKVPLRSSEISIGNDKITVLEHPSPSKRIVLYVSGRIASSMKIPKERAAFADYEYIEIMARYSDNSLKSCRFYSSYEFAKRFKLDRVLTRQFNRNNEFNFYIKIDDINITGLFLKFYDADKKVVAESPVFKVNNFPRLEWDATPDALTIKPYKKNLNSLPVVSGAAFISGYTQSYTSDSKNHRVIKSIPEEGITIPLAEIYKLRQQYFYNISLLGYYTNESLVLNRNNMEVKYLTYNLQSSANTINIHFEGEEYPKYNKNNVKISYKNDTYHHGHNFKDFSICVSHSGNLRFRNCDSIKSLYEQKYMHEIFNYVQNKDDKSISRSGFPPRGKDEKYGDLYIRNGFPREFIVTLENDKKLILHSMPDNTKDLRAISGNNKVVLNWTPPVVNEKHWVSRPVQLLFRQDVSKFKTGSEFYYQKSLCASKIVTVLPADATFFEDTTVENGKLYRYTVKMSGYVKQQSYSADHDQVVDKGFPVIRHSNNVYAKPKDRPVNIGLLINSNTSYKEVRKRALKVVEIINSLDKVNLLDRENLEKLKFASSIKEFKEKYPTEADIIIEVNVTPKDADMNFNIWVNNYLSNWKYRIYSESLAGNNNVKLQQVLIKELDAYIGLNSPHQLKPDVPGKVKTGDLPQKTKYPRINYDDAKRLLKDPETFCRSRYIYKFYSFGLPVDMVPDYIKIIPSVFASENVRKSEVLMTLARSSNPLAQDYIFDLYYDYQTYDYRSDLKYFNKMSFYAMEREIEEITGQPARAFSPYRKTEIPEVIEIGE